ncbi:MAG: leucine-rich repeat protein [Bacteroidales bacterium]|nr:leucine-rich repeat protein [Bacteroidales bacterium]
MNPNFTGKSIKRGWRWMGVLSCLLPGLMASAEDVVEVDVATPGTLGTVLAAAIDANNAFVVDDVTYKIISETEVSVKGNKEYVGDLVIPATVTCDGVEYDVVEIGAEAFSQSSITTLSIPSSVREIKDDAFSYINTLTEVTIAEGLEIVGQCGFWSCDNLPILQLPRSVKSCDIMVVSTRTTDLRAYIPVYNYDYGLMAAPLDAEEFELADNCTGSEPNAFAGCDKLKVVKLPRAFAEVGNKSFAGCTSLTDIYYPTLIVPSISRSGDNAAFYGVELSNITLHVYSSAVQTFQQYWGYDFNYEEMEDPTPVAIEINVAEPGTLEETVKAAVAEANATIYDMYSLTVRGTINWDDTQYIKYICNPSVYYTLSTDPYTLSYLDLSEAELDGTTTLWNESLSGSKLLQTVILPKSVEEIDRYALSSCTRLTKVVLPEDLKVLGDLALAWDPISTIELPASIERIGEEQGCVFYDCTSLKGIICKAVTPPSLYKGYSDNSFTGMLDKDLIYLFVPAESVETYSTTELWEDFTNIYPLEAFPVSIDAEEVALYVNETFTITPQSAIDGAVFTWTSSNNSIATVNASGVVTAHKAGEVTITATSPWNATAECTVTVSKRTQEIVWEQDFQSIYADMEGIYVDDVIELSAYSTSGLSVEYEWDNNCITLFSRFGFYYIQGVEAGTVVLKAVQVGNDEYEAAEPIECTIIVNILPQEIYWPSFTTTEMEVGYLTYLYAYTTTGRGVNYTIIEGAEHAELNGSELLALSPGIVVVRAYDDGEEGKYAPCFSDWTIEIKETELGLTDISADTECQVFSTSGILLYEGLKGDMGRLAPGIYIMRTPQRTIKITVK